jgi:ribonucleoside-diphosphate reductase alpha chain
MRNATTTTIAPTGTISILAGCSSGIEPLYAVAFERRVLDGDVLVEMHPMFRAMAERAGIWSESLASAVAERGSVRGLDAVPADLQRLFPSAHDVSPEQHVRMQAIFQSASHSGVSKTVNLPRTATPDDVAAIYRLAFDLGCKGVTVYRDGSRDAQVLAFGAADPVETGDVCPECSGTVRRTTGCAACRDCGWSVCE